METGDQLAFLRSLGCDEMQGYYFSRPLPDEELEIFLKNYEETWALKISQERRGLVPDRRTVAGVKSSIN